MTSKAARKTKPAKSTKSTQQDKPDWTPKKITVRGISLPATSMQIAAMTDPNWLARRHRMSGDR